MTIGRIPLCTFVSLLTILTVVGQENGQQHSGERVTCSGRPAAPVNGGGSTTCYNRQGKEYPYNKEKYPVGARCRYTCMKGFSMEGSDAVTCEERDGDVVWTESPSCSDIDECTGSNGQCTQFADCVNTEGSFKCTCWAGYNGDGTNCQDINECSDGIGTCSASASCVNTAGSFRCRCNPGYRRLDTTCKDIDECASSNGRCSQFADCVNTEGSFKCTCRAGYNGDGTNCQDIDECANEVPRCIVSADCVNTPGSYSCTCKQGYTGNGRTCTQIQCDEPSVTNGHYDCVGEVAYGGTCWLRCDRGYDVSPTSNAGIQCRGTGKWSRTLSCAMISCSPPKEVKNMKTVNCNRRIPRNQKLWLGSVCTYTCEAGFTLHGNNEVTCNDDANDLNGSGSWTKEPTCEDTNECEGTMPCGQNANCLNTEGSYKCKCQTGYGGDGISCTRLNCTVPTVHNGWSDCSGDVEYGATCKFNCDTGYDFSSGSVSSLTCLGDKSGKWNGQTPSCERVTCGWPRRVDDSTKRSCIYNGKPEYYPYEAGTVCSYECNKSYNFVDGRNTATCVDGDGVSDARGKGTWTTAPVCTMDLCYSKPCLPGECHEVGGKVSCRCTVDTFGPYCKDDRIEMKFLMNEYTVPYGGNARISAMVSIFDDGRANFFVSINGREEKEFAIPERTQTKRFYHDIRDVVKSAYISGKAVLQGQTATTKYDCAKIVISNERKFVNASEDVCSPSQLLIKWEPVNIAFGHTVHISDGRGVAVDAKTYDIDPGIASYTASGLKPKTSYHISVTPHILGCSNITQVLDSYTTTGITSLGVPKPPEKVQLKQEGNHCTVSWHSSGRPQDMDGYQLRIEETERQLMRSSGEPHLEARNNSAASVVINHRFVMNPNTVYKVYIGVVPLPSCFGRIKTKWSTNQTGSCITGPSSPNKVEPPEMDNAKGSSFTLKNVNERNGLVSCYFVIVRKANGSSSNATTPVANITQLKQANDTVLDGEPFIALAYIRFDEPRDVKLGDDTTTCCDMSGNGTCPKTDNKRRRRKRDTGSSTVVKARNHPLEPGSSYEVYVLVSTPTDDGSDPVLKASPVSTFVQKEEEHVPESQVGMLVAVVLVCLFLLIIIIVGVLLYRRHMQKKRLDSMPERMPMRGGNPANQADDIIIVAGGQRQKPEDIVDRALASCTFLLADLSEVMNEKRANEDMIFLDEFKTMIPNAIKECRPTAEIAKLPANLVKNRYRNIVPHDNARVELKKLPRDEFSDYINATHIDGYNAPRKFIAAQGPKPETVKDFWRMVWEHQCSVIAVLTRLTEKKKVKCAQYWSEDEDQVALYDTITVNLVETTSYGDFVRRKFEVTRDKEVREVLQYQFVAWPDHGTPDTTSSLLRFHQTVMYSQPPGAGPVVVHCSAGVGRTGTFVALDILREKIARQERINVAQIVGRMRIRRPEMVQTLDQYIFIHKLVLELYHFGETGIDVSDFSRVYNELRQLNNGRSGIEQEFAMLDYFAPLDTIQDSSSKLENKKLSRDPSILPYDRNAVFVQMQPTDKNVPYYNGTSIATYDSGSRFIAAQTPTSASVDLFWRAVVNNNVDIIVMLCEKAEPANFSFWPEKSDEGKYGSITVRNLEENADMGFVERTFSVTSRDKKMTVCQICYDQWPDDATPSSSGLILEIIAKVEKHYQTLAESKKKTTLVHCSDGSGRTGAFCAISNLIDRLKNENHIDLFRTVKDLRDQRIMMVRTLAQYEFCYQAVSEFLESFDLYGNFR